jgi:hypothetical protein
MVATIILAVSEFPPNYQVREGTHMQAELLHVPASVETECRQLDQTYDEQLSCKF